MGSTRALIAPSILAADYLRMGEELASIASADWVHFDVMDGNFVPNLTFGTDMVRAVASSTFLPIDCHLMIEDPDRWVEDYARAGASIVTFHYEAAKHAQRLCHQLRNLGVKAGIAINPGTPVEVLCDLLDYVDLILVMTVNPGFGGQPLIERSYDKLRRLSDMCAKRDVSPLIEVDGGVVAGNALELAKSGADVLVCGSAVFGATDRAGAIGFLREEAQRGVVARG